MKLLNLYIEMDYLKIFLNKKNCVKCHMFSSETFNFRNQEKIQNEKGETGHYWSLVA